MDEDENLLKLEDSAVILYLGNKSTPNCPRLHCDLDKLTVCRVKELRNAMNECRDDLAKKIQDNANKLREMGESYAKKPKETKEAYEARLKQLEQERKDLGLGDYDDSYIDFCFNCLKRIAIMWEQESRLTEESFSNTPWAKVKNFLYTICTKGDVAAAVLFRSEG